MRNVPDKPHRTLKARAALSGKSLSEYLIDEMRLLADRPTPDEMRRRLAGRVPAAVSRPSAEVIRDERDDR